MRHLSHAVFACALAGGCSQRDAGPKADAGPTASSTVASTASPPPPSKLPAGFARARAFVFNRDPKAKPCFSILAQDATLCPSAQLPGIVLSREQTAHAIAAFDEPARPLDTAPWCFNPHHAVVLYDEADVPLAAMSICFECERQDLWLPQGPGQLGNPPLSLHALDEFEKLFCQELQMHPCETRYRYR